MRTVARRLALFLVQACAAAALTGGEARARAQEARGPAEAPAGRVLTLAQIERSATEAQPQILVARAATLVARGQAEQARAPMLPQVTTTASYARQTGNFAPRPGATPQPNAGAAAGWSLSQSYDFWNFGVTATQLLYDFGQTSEKYHAAQASMESQEVAERTARLIVLSAVRKAYFNARAAKELVDVARETLGDQNKHLMQVQGFVQVGTQPEVALAQQKAAVANAQVQLITAQNNYETAKAQLNQAAGYPGGTEYDVSDETLSAVEDEDQPLEVLVAKAVSARPELVTIAKQREAQQATLSSARGGYGPTFAASAGATEAGTALDGLVPNWTAGVSMTWPLFQGGLTRGQVHQAEAALQSVEAQKSLEELQVRLDVDTARLSVRAAKATIAAADDALANAREQLHLAEQRYATGVGSIIELADAQVSYTSAAAQVVQARYSLSSARAQLLAALGRT
jgi:outer membrane protein